MSGPPNIEYKWTYNKEGFYTDDVNKSLAASVYMEKVIDTSTMLLKTHFQLSESEMKEATHEASKVINQCKLLCNVITVASAR